MAHLRTQIANAVKTAVTGLTTTSTRVYAGRVYPMSSAKMPGLLVYRGGEGISNRTLALRRVQDRTFDIRIEAVAMAAEDTVEAMLDLILAEVEVALSSDPTFGGLAKDSRLVRVDEASRVTGGDSSKPVATLKATLEIFYMTREGTPDTSL